MVYVFDPEYIAPGSVKIFEVFPRILLDVFGTVLDQGLEPLPPGVKMV